MFHSSDEFGLLASGLLTENELGFVRFFHAGFGFLRVVFLGVASRY
jgi:hypothetical protein